MNGRPPSESASEPGQQGRGEPQNLVLPHYDIVIATRNRNDALALSLPLILTQVPPPQQLVIVDASSDHTEVVATVRKVERANASTSIKLIRSPPGSSLQRNRGLQEVTAPIVFFPDDDALWHPEFARRVLEVYARDTEGIVGGVGALEVEEMPAGAQPSYDRETAARWNLRLMPIRYHFERKVFPEPLNLAAQAMMATHELPSWVDGVDIVAVEHVTGFRMSYRTPLIAAVGFDENLAGYGLAEDADISLRTWREHLLLVDHRARVKHFKRPGGRESGRRDGYFHIVNYVYVVAKHSMPGSPARRRMMPWALYRCAMYAARARDVARRERLRGALAALPVVRRIAAARDEHVLLATYLYAAEHACSWSS